MKNSNIGLIIKDLQTKRSLTNRDMSILLGVSDMAIGNIKKATDCNTKYLRILCQKFDLDVNYFFDTERKSVYENSVTISESTVSDSPINYTREPKRNIEIEYLKRENELLRQLVEQLKQAKTDS